MQEFLEKLPEHLKQHLDSSLGRERRLMAAKGLLPLPPRELIIILYALVQDDDEDIRSEALNSLLSIPENVMLNIVSDSSTKPEVLDFVAKNITNESLHEKIILNNSSFDSTLIYLAENIHSQNLIELIANNHIRILRTPKYLEALGKNPSISRSTIDGVVSFLQRYIDVKGYTHDLPGVQTEEEDRGDETGATLDDIPLKDIEESFLDEIEFTDDLVEENDEPIVEVLRENLLSKIKQMNFAERIKLSMMGNREARTILIRDPNRVVACAVLRNPRVAESEVTHFAQSKVVVDDVLRLISESRKWIKLYQIKVSIVTNPKTPPDISLKYVRHLLERDLRSIMNDKNLPGVIMLAARRMFRERKDR